MDYKTENTHIQQLISEAIELPHQQSDSDQIPDFDEIAKACREKNIISDEIKVLEIAVQFYESPDRDCDERISNLKKFRTRLISMQKEAKVMAMLGW